MDDAGRMLVLMGLAIALLFGFWMSDAIAASVDPYIRRYFDATEPVSLPLNATETQTFTADEFSNGTQFFAENCINCHVGGNTLPNPSEPLTLEALQEANPPRDTIEALVAFMRQPMTYDGQDISFWCREVPESWLNDEAAATLAAFILRAAEKAPGWGTAEF